MVTLIATLEIPLVLDSDVFTDWRERRPPTVQFVTAYREYHGTFPQLPAIVVFEAQFGFEKQIVKTGSLDQRLTSKREEMVQLIRECRVLDFNQRAAELAAHISARLSHSQRNQHWADLFIAATALAHGYGVATRNRADFELIGQHLPTNASTLYLAVWKS